MLLESSRLIYEYSYIRNGNIVEIHTKFCKRSINKAFEMFLSNFFTPRDCWGAREGHSRINVFWE